MVVKSWAHRGRAILAVSVISIFNVSTDFISLNAYAGLDDDLVDHNKPEMRDPQPNDLVMGLRTGISVTEEFVARYQAQRVDSDTIEFANGNTFPRIDAQDVIGRHVHIVIPAELDANLFMELLAKAHFAHTTGAASVSVAFSEPFSSTIIMGEIFTKHENRFGSWLKAAGVTKIHETFTNVMEYIPEKTLSYPRYQHNGSSVFYSFEDYSLPRELSLGLQLDFNLYRKQTPQGGSVGTQAILFMSPSQPTNVHFFEALKASWELTKAGYWTVMVTPYLPYARSDKRDQYGVTIVGALVANLIEASGTRGVLMVRPHAEQSQGFFRIPSFFFPSRESLIPALKEEGIEHLVAPDAGAQKEVSRFAEEMGIADSTIGKKRNPLTGEIELLGLSGPSVRGKVVALIDDETASGGTLAQAAKHLKSEEIGARKVIAVVSHLAGQGVKAFESAYIDKFIMTNTYPSSSLSPEHLERAKFVSVTPELLPVLRKIAGRSLACEKALVEPREL